MWSLFKNLNPTSPTGAVVRFSNIWGGASWKAKAIASVADSGGSWTGWNDILKLADHSFGLYCTL